MEKRYEVKLGDYKGIKIKAIEEMLSDEELKYYLDMELKRRVEFEESDGPAELGDTVNIDYSGFLGDKKFEGGTASGYDLELGSQTFIPGFEEQLVGTKKGDEIDVNVTFPDPYHSAELAGKAVVFKCKVNAVKKKLMPELTPEFIKETYGVDGGYDAFIKIFRETLQEQKKQAVRDHYEDQAVNAILDSSEIKLFEAALEDAMQQTITVASSQMAAQGLDLETYCKLMGTDMHGLRATLRPQAQKRAKVTAVLNTLAAEAGIALTDDELQEELRKMAEATGKDPEEYTKTLDVSQLTTIREDLNGRKAIDFMMDFVELTK